VNYLGVYSLACPKTKLRISIYELKDHVGEETSSLNLSLKLGPI
jgi:hypothetical protein